MHKAWPPHAAYRTHEVPRQLKLLVLAATLLLCPHTLAQQRPRNPSASWFPTATLVGYRDGSAPGRAPTSPPAWPACATCVSTRPSASRCCKPIPLRTMPPPLLPSALSPTSSSSSTTGLSPPTPWSFVLSSRLRLVHRRCHRKLPPTTPTTPPRHKAGL